MARTTMPTPPKPASRQTPTGRTADSSAIRSVRAHLCIWIVAGLGVWFDLASKGWAFAALGPGETRTLMPGLILSRRSLNSGALFGAFPGWVGVFIIASLLALAFVLYVFACSSRRQWFLHVGLACILAGALGNLHDRAFVEADVLELRPSSGYETTQYIGVVVSPPGADPVVVAPFPDEHPDFRQEFARKDVAHIAHHGVVRDFIKFRPIAGFDYWPWVFNVADALLVVGLVILLITLWQERRQARAAKGTATVATG
jgi:lipoprotein signal peptidase